MSPVAPDPKLDRFERNPFMDGPAQYIVKTVAQLLHDVSQFRLVFGDYIEPYKRMDFPVRAFPAIRMYNNGYEKPDESWFINGDVIIDVLWPASLRRSELQTLPDTISSAILQQFRRPSFFASVRDAEDEDPNKNEGFNLLGVPGLNELGRRFSVDKSLGFQGENGVTTPLTQITVNFKVDLRKWDEYLEDQLRTKDDPFEQTLAELETIATEIQGMRDDNETVEVTVPMEQSV